MRVVDDTREQIIPLHVVRGAIVTEHVHGSDPERCDRCWDVVIDQRVEEGT